MTNSVQRYDDRLIRQSIQSVSTQINMEEPQLIPRELRVSRMAIFKAAV
jgi:hypothetical protein